jgi:MFS transporter, CP family, cyanate transporter
VATDDLHEGAAPESLTGGRAGVLLLIGVLLIAANMRATITGIGPLLDQIGDDFGISATTLGVLAALPLVAWAVVSPLAHDLSIRFGLARVILWAIVILTAGTIWRSLPGNELNLWLGTITIGVALAVANVLMPAVIKRDFTHRVAGLTGVYTALLGGFGALASGVVVPISHIQTASGPLGWQIALVATGILLPFAIALWAWATHASGSERVPRRTPGRRAATGIWADRVAWLVAGYMGLQAAVFYMLVTWLAPISTSTGRSAVVAGIDVMVFQIFGVVGSLVIPLLLRGRMQRWVPALLPTLAIVGTIGLIIAPAAVLVWGALAGLSTGASIGMSLTLMAQRARNHSTAAALSGMSQSIGYVIAALGPILFGALHTVSGGWLLPLLLLLVALIGQGVIGIAVGRERYVLEPR